MARCEDWPCCGHEAGCCPDYDEGGRQLNMICTCGAKLPISNRYSICDSCLNSGDDGFGDGHFEDEWHAEPSYEEDECYDDICDSCLDASRDEDYYDEPSYEDDY